MARLDGRGATGAEEEEEGGGRFRESSTSEPSEVGVGVDVLIGTADELEVANCGEVSVK